MDKMMKQLYKMLFNLEVDKCRPLDLDISKKMIFIDEKNISLDDFLSKNSELITIDAYDPTTDEEKKQLKGKFVYLEKGYSVIKVENKAIGYKENTLIYNGFPNVIKTQELAENPAETFIKGIKIIDSRINTIQGRLDYLAEPESLVIKKIYLLPEYFSKIMDKKEDQDEKK